MSLQRKLPFRVASAIPGRIRLQLIGGRRHKGYLEQTVARLSRLDAVREVEVVADAGSVIVHYEARRRDLAEVLRRMESAVSAIVPEPSSALPAKLPSSATWKRVRQDSAAPVQDISLRHFFPGRVRLHIPELRKEFGLHVERELEATHGFGDVTLADEEFMIVRYDPKVHRVGSVVKQVGRLLHQAARSSPGRSELTRARDIPAEEPRRLNPLLLPSVAVALAATGVMPAAVLGGAMILAGLPVASRAAEGVRSRRFNVEQLDVAALGVLAWLGDFFTAGLITWLIGLGDLIRERTMRRSRRAIAGLMSPAEQKAWVNRDGSIVSVVVDTLRPGDVVLVYPGDRIPVDGVVTEGRALVDQKTLTGEPVPVAKGAGDAVFALTMVADGQLSIRVEHIGSETRAGRVVEMIEDAPLSDTRIQNYAAKIGDRLVGPIFALAGASFLLTGDPLRAASLLILDFATGIRVSAPTTILSAMTGAAHQGLFIKGGKAMEDLARVDAIVFDKTGTLTRGEPHVTAVDALDAALGSDEVLRLAACAEANLKHPSAKAIVDAAKARGLEITPPTDMDYTMGGGVEAVVEGQRVHVGSERYIQQIGIDSSRAAGLTSHHHAAGNSLVYVALSGRLIGILGYSDPPRAESALVVKSLRERGVKRIVMLTGDNARAAQAVAAQLGITDVVADAFPEQKAGVVQAFRDQGYTVAVIGDGINDSPAFTRAHVGISLEHGADVAKETADVILLDGDLRGLPRAIDLSREALGILKQNVNVIVIPTAVGMAGAVLGLTTPLFSTMLSNGTAVLAGLNALRPLFRKETAYASLLQAAPVQAAPAVRGLEGTGKRPSERVTAPQTR